MTVDLTQAAALAAEVREWLRDEKYFHNRVTYHKLAEIAKLLDSKISAFFRELNYEEKQQINNLVTVELLRTGVMKIDNPIQPEVTPATGSCLEPYRWSCYDGVSTEIEVLEFLHAFVRMIKPKTILETGTYLGHAAVYMALAQKQNGFGNLLSCDTDEEVLKRAISLAMQNDIQMNINFVLRQGCDVISQMDERSLDLVFIDSGDEQTRIDEINLVLRKIVPGGFLIVHDIKKLNMVRSHLHYLEHKAVLNGMCIKCTPRGLGLYQVI